MLNCKYFTTLPTPLICLDRNCQKYHIAQSGFEGAVQKSYSKEKASEFCRPAMTINDILDAVRTYPATITKEYMAQFVEYGKSIKMKIDEPYSV